MLTISHAEDRSWANRMVERNGTEGMVEVRERGCKGLEQSTAARRSSNIDRSGVEFEARQVSVSRVRGREREGKRKREQENGNGRVSSRVDLSGEAKRAACSKSSPIIRQPDRPVSCPGTDPLLRCPISLSRSFASVHSFLFIHPYSFAFSPLFTFFPIPLSCSSIFLLFLLLLLSSGLLLSCNRGTDLSLSLCRASTLKSSDSVSDLGELLCQG